VKEIALTKGYVAIVDDEDFDLVKGLTWCCSLSGLTLNYPYAITTVECRRVRMHRLIAGLEPGDKRVVDHINGDTLDNRRKNLRIVTSQQNSWNSRAPRGRKKDSRFKGVQKARNKWRATIWQNGRKYHLGVFHSERAAALAYKRAARKLRGEYAHPAMEVES